MKRINEEQLNRMAEFIRRFIAENNGRAPRFGEICAYMDMTNSVAYRYMTILRDRGVVEYHGKSTLTVKSPAAQPSAFCRVPILGAIPCGKPEDDREEPEAYLAIPAEWASGECFLLRTKYDSMIDVGISPGDLVLIRRSNDAADRQVVVALTEEGPTLKRFRQNGREAWLEAENRTFPASERVLHPRQIEIQGICLKVIKDIP